MPFGDLILGSRSSGDVLAMRLLLVVLAVWLVLGLTSCNEIRLSLQGKTATAQVVQRSASLEFAGGGGLTYRFTDGSNGELRQAMVEGAKPDEFADTFEVAYVPGAEGTAVPVSRRSMFWPALFALATLAAMVLAAVVAARRWRARREPAKAGAWEKRPRGPQRYEV